MSRGRATSGQITGSPVSCVKMSGAGSQLPLHCQWPRTPARAGIGLLIAAVKFWKNFSKLDPFKSPEHHHRLNGWAGVGRRH